MNRLFSYFIMFLSLIGQNCFSINPAHISKSHKSRTKKSFTKICKLKFALFKKAIKKNPVKHGLIGTACGVAGAGLALSLGVAGLAASRHHVYNKLISGPAKDSWNGDVTFNSKGSRSPQSALHYSPAPVVFAGETNKWGWQNTTTIASTEAGIQSILVVKDINPCQDASSTPTFNPNLPLIIYLCPGNNSFQEILGCKKKGLAGDGTNEKNVPLLKLTQEHDYNVLLLNYPGVGQSTSRRFMGDNAQTIVDRFVKTIDKACSVHNIPENTDKFFIGQGIGAHFLPRVGMPFSGIPLELEPIKPKDSVSPWLLKLTGWNITSPPRSYPDQWQTQIDDLRKKLQAVGIELAQES